MIGVTPRFDVMVSDLILSLKVTPAVLLMNFISAAVILLLSVFFSAHTSHPYVIIGTASVLYTFILVSFCTLILHFITKVSESIDLFDDFSIYHNFTSYSIFSFEGHSFGFSR